MINEKLGLLQALEFSMLKTISNSVFFFTFCFMHATNIPYPLPKIGKYEKYATFPHWKWQVRP